MPHRPLRNTTQRIALALTIATVFTLLTYGYASGAIRNQIFDYQVTNADGIHFADAFHRLGGVATLGYPASYRFRTNDGFTYQVTQAGILQWNPHTNRINLANTFQMLEEANRDQWLLTAHGVPLPIQDDGSGGDWEKAKATRLSWLTNPEIKAKYFANPNPDAISDWSIDLSIQLYGLPMSKPERHGPFISQRFQRIVFQFWVQEVTGAPAPGTVTRVLGGDLAKLAGLIPHSALAPQDGGTGSAPPSDPPPPATATPAAVPLSHPNATAHLWIYMENGRYNRLEVFAQVFVDLDRYDLDVFVHGYNYCNADPLFADDQPIALSCHSSDWSHTSITQVSARIEDDPLICVKNDASNAQTSTFACVYRDLQ